MWASIIHLSSCSSTQDWAIRHTDGKGAPFSGVVMSDMQSSGRGQRNRVWQSSPHASLCATYWMQLTPTQGLPMPWLSIAVGLATYQSLLDWKLPQLALKWPNDIYCKGAKLGGILIEVKPNGFGVRYAYMGVGLNVNQVPTYVPNSTSMQEVSGYVWDIDELQVSLNERMGKYVSQWHTGHKALLHSFHSRYEEVLYGRNEWHTYQTPSQGTFQARLLGIDAQARLRLQTKTHGIQSFSPTQIKVRKD